jgi:hypothetical protein
MLGNAAGSPPLPSGRSVLIMRGISSSFAVKYGSLSLEQLVIAADSPQQTKQAVIYFRIFLVVIVSNF